MQQQANPMVLVWNKFCPFAQRALITAYQKELSFELKHGSLKNKQEFFVSLYSQAFAGDKHSTGKVPILVHNNRVLAESELICWYMAETFSSGHNLIPKDTFMRLRMRWFIAQQANQMIRLYNSAKTQSQDMVGLTQKTDQLLRQVNQAIAGPYILGEQVSLADIFIYPWFQRWAVIEHYFGIPIDLKYSKVLTWIQCMKSRPAIIKSKEMTNDYYFIERSRLMMMGQSKL